MISRAVLALALSLCALNAGAVSLDDNPQLCSFITMMVDKYQFAPSDLRRWFEHTEIKPEIIEAMERPRESLPWFQYKKSFVTDEQARKGAKFWRAHSAIVDQAAKDYGVPPEIILAIVGVETQYGKNLGRYAVIDALTTLMLKYPPRADFFRHELEEYLLLTRDLGIDPLKMKGSYAGAIGIGQFMPSSYRQFAVDFDGDSKRDLIGSPADALASVANYFHLNGWRVGAPVVSEIRIDAALYEPIASSDLEPRFTPKQLVKYGIVNTSSEVLDDGLVNIVRLQEEDRPVYYIGYENFYVITRYNRSRHYAMAVYELAQRIRNLYQAELNVSDTERVSRQ